MKTFWKKLIKLSVTISLFFAITFTSFANTDLTKEEYKQMLQATAIALAETNTLLEEANEKIISLEKEISESDSALYKDLLKKARDALEDSNAKLAASNAQFDADQEEIERLRGLLQDCIDNIEEPTMFTLGGGVTYPYGGQIIFIFDIPKIPVSAYTNISITIEPFGFLFTIGAAYSF
jgi:hypothetical protein